MFARVNVLLETRPNAVMVPEQAIWPQGRDAFVYRVVDGKAVLTKVEIGSTPSRRGRSASKGLAADDMVVTDGQMKIKDGAPVMVLPAPPAPPPQPANGSCARLGVGRAAPKHAARGVRPWFSRKSRSSGRCWPR